MPMPVVGRHVRHHFGPVDVEDESGIVGQRQRMGLVVGCVREDGTVILLDQRAESAVPAVSNRTAILRPTRRSPVSQRW